ncbi:MAG: DUF6468 domain-containing protein [Proteobacteria bacterium]|nr:DUF6468 domain-containing protein [Pseudomonadota bacterium]
MSTGVVLFEVVMALLMLALIVYCVKLNRGLAAVRGQDAQIKQMIAELNMAADRAEASVARLKAAGLSAEAAVRASIEDAEQARSLLAARNTTMAATQPMSLADDLASKDAADAAVDAALFNTGEGFMPNRPQPARDQNRGEAEASVLQAIRAARGSA